MTNPYERPDLYGLLPLATLAEDVDDGYNIVAAWYNKYDQTFLAHDGSYAEYGPHPFAEHSLASLEEVRSLDEAIAFVESCGFPRDARYAAFLEHMRRHFNEE